jgi:hypothetical protein
LIIWQEDTKLVDRPLLFGIELGMLTHPSKLYSARDNAIE